MGVRMLGSGGVRIKVRVRLRLTTFKVGRKCESDVHSTKLEQVRVRSFPQATPRELQPNNTIKLGAFVLA